MRIRINQPYLSAIVFGVLWSAISFSQAPAIRTLYDRNFQATMTRPGLLSRQIDSLPPEFTLSYGPYNSRPFSVTQTQNFNYPLDTCFTYTFKLKTGDVAGQTFIKESLTSVQGVVFITGYTIDAGGKKSGLLQMLDHSGTIAWSRSFEHASRSIYFRSMGQLNNGHITLVGTSEDINGSNKMMLLVATDVNGNLIWSKTLNYPGYTGAGISPTTSNGIGFTGNDDSTMVYGKLDYSGNLVWLKRTRLMEKGAVVGMTKYDYDQWYIAYSGIDSSRHVGFVLQINPLNGNITWANKLGGLSVNKDFIFHDLELTNIRPRIVGIFSENQGAYSLFKATFNGTSNLETFQQFTIPSVIFDTSSFSTITPWAEVIAFSPSSNDPDIYSFKTINEANPDTMIHWRKRFQGIGQHQLVNAERAFDGGFLFTANVTGTAVSQGFLLKTDSIGWLKNCEGNDFTLYSTVRFNTPTVLINLTATDPAVSLIAETINVVNTPLPSTYECRHLSCPDRVQEDACLSSYNRSYRGSAFCDLGRSLLTEDANHVSIIGIMRDNPYDPATDNATLIKVDAIGKLVDRKKMNIGNRGGFSQVNRMMDGSLLALGSCVYTSPFTSYDTGYVTITKLTAGYGFIWNKSFPIYGPYSAIYDLLESQDGSLFLNYIEGKNFCENISLMKLDILGNLLWIKDYNVPNSCIFGYVGSMAQDNNFLYVMNWGSGTPGMLLLKIRKTDGSVVWTKGYNITGADQMKTGNDLTFIGDDLVVQGRADGAGWSKDVVMVIDTNGVVKHSRFFQGADNYSTGFVMTVTQNRQVVLCGGGWYNNSFIRLDSTLKIINCKQAYPPPSGVMDITEGPDGSILSLGYFYYPNAYENDISLKKYTYDGMLGGCFVDTLLLNTGTQAIITSAVTANIFDNNAILYSLPYSEATYSLQENKLLCSEVAACNAVDITAPAGICDTLQHTISVTRNPGCKAPVYFAYDNNYLQVISRTDTTMLIKCLQSGATSIKAKIFTGCQWIEDSVLLNISLYLTALDIGPDTSICPANTLILNAKKGYASYLWNDGSTDSLLTVTVPGQYYVDVTDACGNVLSDTITISPAPPIAFDIGPDRTKCNNDTLHLTAPGGFLNYTWGPAYNINSQVVQQVVVQPTTDTSYFVRAEKTPGCFAYDTVRITVNTSPPILLGADKSFCQGDSAVLNAGTGFAQYQWSNGNNSHQITVHATGAYSVTGTTAEGCKSYDTLHVINVWSNPVVSLNDDPELCIGSTRTLQAGNFLAYLWHDGSTSSSFVINNTGTYYVTVWDNNQCRGSDTVRIIRLLPLPAGFLPADTAICNYGSLVIKPTRNFTNYSWSNNSASAHISVTVPGIYWLQVTDDNQCTGRDSILVSPKECLKGFYIPNAFTPDKNGRNDDFKPFIGGAVKQYRFTIYNRWGQIVFTTTDLLKGWDGTFGGTQQDTNVFAWLCTYQPEGETVKVEKGTVVLIR